MKEARMEITAIILSLEVSMLLGLAYGLHCNEKEYATIGQDVVIDCQLRFVSNVYWYSEKTSFESALVKIENEQKVILEAGKGNYDISETGALVIKDVVEERCGLYKLVRVNKDATFEEAFVRLELLNKPRQDCLVVSLCDSCYCSSDARTKHNVSCSVLGARPQVNVSLNTENEDLYNVTVRHNTDTDTFDTIAHMEVSIDTCGSKLTVRCTVVGSNIFGIKDSSMDLNSAPCVQTTDTLTDATAKDEDIFAFLDGFRLVIVVVFVVTAVVICLVVIVCVTVCKKGRTDNSKKENQERDIGLNATEPLLERSSHLSEGEMEKLIKHLQDRYQSMSYIKPLPWGEKVLIDELYTETICNVTYPNRPRETKTSKSLLDPTVSQELKRALFIADIGHGKTTLRQYLACEWSRKELKEQKKEMLFILPLTGIDINAGIGEQLHKTLPGEMNISREQLCDIILKRKCHLLLDGLDEISQHEKTSSTHVVSPGDILLKRLLNESMLSQYPHLRLWVTSRKIDQSKRIYGKPYVEVEILGFNADEIKTYVRKTLEYYKRLKPREQIIIHKDGLNDSSDVPKDNVTSEENDEEIIKKTISTLDENDLVQIFKDTPMFIVMFIHIIMSKLLTINEAINELNSNKMSSLVSSVIACLDIRFLEKRGNENMARELRLLRMKLAKASLNYSLDINESITNFDLNEARLQDHEIEMAQSIGYIKPIKALHSVGMSKSDNVFSHEYIQELCIAEYIVSKDLDPSQKILKALEANKIEENIRRSRILRFICGISTTTKREEALRFLLTNRCWNTLTDCMFESENVEDIIDMDFNAESVKPSTLLLNLPSDSKMKVVRLDERYHQNAFKLFMGKCLRSNLNFDSISIGSECPLKFLLSLTLPMVDTFELRNIFCVNEESSNTFLEIIFWAMKTNVNKRIRFLKGNVPGKVDCRDIKGSPFKIAHNSDGSDIGNDYILDLGNGTWKRNLPLLKGKFNPL